MVVINTNIDSLKMQKGLISSSQNLSTSLKRLSSGLRINSAADDAAGLALSDEFAVRSSSGQVARKNAQTGVNLVQVLDDSYAVATDILFRMRDLAVQSANGIYSDEEREALNSEYSTLEEELSKILTGMKFGDLQLFNVADPYADFNLELQIGTGDTSNDKFSINVKNPYGIATGIIDVGSVSSASTAIGSMDLRIADISKERAKFGSYINQLNSIISGLEVGNQNMRAAKSTITDTDIAVESANIVKNQIIQQTSATLLAQANQTLSIALNIVSN